jgi:hypothetical protein
VEVKTKGTFGRDKWLKGTCQYDSATREFICTDSTGKERRLTQCWLVDVANRQGKRQHRFDIDSDGSQQPMALAAEGASEKQRWVAAVETKEALRSRQADQALMAKHGVSTIEEAKRKEAEARRKEQEEQDQALMAKYGASTIEEARRKEAEEEERKRRERTPPSAPDALSASSPGNPDSFVLNWRAPSSLTMITLYEVSKNGSSCTSTSGGSTSVEVSGSMHDTHRMRVRAQNAGGWSGWSNELVVDGDNCWSLHG